MSDKPTDLQYPKKVEDQEQQSTHANLVINHQNFLADSIAKLQSQPEDFPPDIILKVEGVSFPANKCILACQSEFFRVMFYSSFSESKEKEIELKDISSPSFRNLLTYLYSGKLDLGMLKDEELIDLLSLSHQFSIAKLETAVSDFLCDHRLQLHSVCPLYDVARMFHQTKLLNRCQSFIDHHAETILEIFSFLNLSESSLFELISRHTFCAPEIKIFKAVMKWHSENGAVNLNKLLSAVRFPLIPAQELFTIVRNSNLVPADTILDALEYQNRLKDGQPPSPPLSERGILYPNRENVATEELGATVIRGEMKNKLLNGDTENYDLDTGYTRHPIEPDPRSGRGIVVRLGRPTVINSVTLLLWDQDARSYSYFVEASLDDQRYFTIADRTRFKCRSWQFIRFPTCVAKYIRICGTHNTVNRVFHLVSLMASYDEELCRRTPAPDNIMIPSSNVASVAKHAQVIDGVSRTRNSLIDGDYEHYDWDAGYTCHQILSGSMCVQLAQPYILSAMRILLWDCDSRQYSYYVEVSTNGCDFTVVCDRSNELCKSWQLITFTPQPVVFIRITGTRNTHNEVFHVVHIESPPDRSQLTEEELEQVDAVSPDEMADKSDSEKTYLCPVVGTVVSRSPPHQSPAKLDRGDSQPLPTSPPSVAQVSDWPDTHPQTSSNVANTAPDDGTSVTTLEAGDSTNGASRPSTSNGRPNRAFQFTRATPEQRLSVENILRQWRELGIGSREGSAQFPAEPDQVATRFSDDASVDPLRAIPIIPSISGSAHDDDSSSLRVAGSIVNEMAPGTATVPVFDANSRVNKSHHPTHDNGTEANGEDSDDDDEYS